MKRSESSKNHDEHRLSYCSQKESAVDGIVSVIDGSVRRGCSYDHYTQSEKARNDGQASSFKTD